MKRNTKILLGLAAVAGAYWLWKNNKTIKSMTSKPNPREIRNGEECVANGYYWGGTGIRAACYRNEEAAKVYTQVYR